MSWTRRQLLTCSMLSGLAAGCANPDPFAGGDTPRIGGSSTLVVGSQQYYSNEIIAELYAQVLEQAGYKVDRQYHIGPRETYIPELRGGKIDVFPEYGGNLLQYLDSSAKATTDEQIASALAKALPEGLRVLPAAPASDQDSFNVTADFAAQHGLTSLTDLAKVSGLKIAANSEFAARPYGPAGLKATYGVTVELIPVEDSGGPLTVKALLDGTVQLADIYSADPVIGQKSLVTLSDPKNLVLPQRITPVVSAAVDTTAEAAIAKVNVLLTQEALLELNRKSVEDQSSSQVIARTWLAEQGLM